MRAMKAFGRFIKQTRKKRGMTQDELAFDICSVRYLSNIENGKQYPTVQIVELMSHKLGFDLAKYFSYSPYADPIQIFEIKANLERLFNNAKYSELKQEVESLTQNEDFQSPENIQLLTWYKAAIALEVHHNIHEAYIELDKAFHITNKNNINDSLPKQIYTEQEIQILITYSKLIIEDNRFDEAIKVIDRIVKTIDSYSKIWIEKHEIYKMKLGYNKALLLFNTSNYSDALIEINLMMQTVLESHNILYISNYFYLKGMVLSELDQHEMGFECFDKFFQLRSIAETKETLNQSRSYLEQTYNYIIKKEKDIE